MVRNIKSDKGFTLVELLVVVAIIGVLATAGIPQYRRMVQSSKKSEAKIMLGEIGTAEGAFFAEWGTYGSNLAGMGVEVEGNGTVQRIYSTGFTKSDCTPFYAQAAAVPTSGSGVGGQISLSTPLYYDATSYASIVGRTSRTVCFDTSAVASNKLATPTSAVYTAAATGSICGGISLDTDTGGCGKSDRWTMINTRVLTNTQNGSD